MPRLRRLLLTLIPSLLGAAAAATTETPAGAFCGFYVAGADAKLFADATQVVLMREGTRTVLSMQNDYKGPPEAFAMVVPVPVVLAKENVKTLPRAVFEKIDRLGAPRLVEYWEQDPCAPDSDLGFGMGGLGLSGIGSGGGGRGIGAGALGVTVEAKFAVGEYDVVILGAKDSSGLDQWLRQEKYVIPEGAEPYFRPYVQAGSKFFVAKVDPKKVKFENGRAALSPIRFHYDSETFSLPVRLGLVNSGGAQDLVIDVLAREGRFEVANYPTVTIPTNLDVAESARARFGEFYAALFDATVASTKAKAAVVTEYAWDPGTCDPCPGPTLDGEDLATFGADVVPSGTAGLSGGRRGSGVQIKTGSVTVKPAGLPKEVVQRIVRQNFGRFRLCYDRGLSTNPTLAGRVPVRFDIRPSGEVANVSSAGGTLADKGVEACVARAFTNLTFPQPEGGAAVTVEYPIDFAPPDPNAPPPPSSFSFGSGVGGGTPYTLTRLHVRYTKDSLGEDLVFRAAKPISGGREVRPHGQLESGAAAAPTNNFQARYAIRHAWTGPIACKEPRRGVWGGPPPGDAGASALTLGTPAPVAASKLAFAPRGKLELASMIGEAAAADVHRGGAGAAAQGDGGVGSPPSAAAPAPADGGSSALAPASAPSATPAKRGSCSASPPATAPGRGALGLAVALAAVARLRRTRR